MNSYFTLLQDDFRELEKLSIDWNKLRNKSILISGSTGMVGSFLILFLSYLNTIYNLNLKIRALGRNKEKSAELFSELWSESYFEFIEQDINQEFNINERFDYIIHLASNTHPNLYATDPIGTILTNIYGTRNLLEISSLNPGSRFLFASSNEIYGENRGDTELFSEDYCGFINPNTLRAGYPESKRVGEALCQAYMSKNNVDVVIARLTRSFGPTLDINDSKALSQFLRNGINNEKIVLKSAGNQHYSYSYVADVVSGLLYILLYGKYGEAYNIADESFDITLKDLAHKIADFSETQVIFDLPDEIESKGFSVVTKARLNGSKIRNELGWKPIYDMDYALKKTLYGLKKIWSRNKLL